MTARLGERASRPFSVGENGQDARSPEARVGGDRPLEIGEGLSPDPIPWKLLKTRERTRALPPEGARRQAKGKSTAQHFCVRYTSAQYLLKKSS